MPTSLQRSRSRLALASAACLILAPALHASEKSPVIVHEWGTFTSLQDEHGDAIGGINVDDEPVPGFVFQYANRMVAGQYSAASGNFGLPPYNADGGKGWTVGDPGVTMRLETPVIYIYPPKGRAAYSVPPLDVHVDFHGGVLSQFYPYAQTNGADLNGDLPYLQNPRITESTITGLTWTGVQLGVDGKPFASRNAYEKNTPWLRGAVVETDDKVWTTPRETAAPPLGVNFVQDDYAHPGKKYDCAQAEHFLFYRGVGHLNSPLRIREAGDLAELSLRSATTMGTPLPGWMVEIRPDGMCAFRTMTRSGELFNFNIAFLGAVKASFAQTDFNAANLDALKASMQAELVKQGLYGDEASAMLRTWELSYFKSPGLRFFYVVPREWTERVLPLRISGVPVRITRVMIGRIELISDVQKAALARLAAGPAPDLQAVKAAARKALDSSKFNEEEKTAFFRGDRPLRELGIVIPPRVQDYLDLGRFRDALVLREERLHPSVALAQFIKLNSIGPAVTSVGAVRLNVAAAAR